ncbi:MAG: mandelate racemase/muconate lactonizing enzyme family protein [Pseudomonadota bacterium]
MKLQDIEVFVTANPPPSKGGRYFIFVKLVTACGIVGYGEIYAASFGPHVIKRATEDVFVRHFAGEDPHRIEHLYRLTYSTGYHQRPDPTLMAVFSGLEIACWDIVGKSAGKPVYDLLGGKTRERLRTYTYLYPAGDDAHGVSDGPSVYDDPDIAASRALEYVAQGFTAVKFDPAGPYTAYDGRQPDLEALERSALFCKRIREAVGARADLLFGTHGQFTASGAKRMARLIEPYDPLWFEEPTPPESPEMMAEVARSTAVPIATGERLTTKYEFSRVLALGAASILQPALSRVGGILEAKKIAAMAEPFYAVMAPHLYCGPVEGAANVQFAACIPNFLVLESIERFDGPWGDFIRQGIRWEDGAIVPPTEPGLGIELDEDLCRSLPYEDDALHLSMMPDARNP